MIDRATWRELRLTLRRKFYFIHSKPSSTSSAGKMPYVTICLLWDPTTGVGSRGVAVCHPRDNPDKRVGRTRANSWAERAYFHAACITATPTMPEVLDRLAAALVERDDHELSIATVGDCNGLGTYLGGRYLPMGIQADPPGWVDPAHHYQFTKKELELLRTTNKEDKDERPSQVQSSGQP